MEKKGNLFNRKDWAKDAVMWLFFLLLKSKKHCIYFQTNVYFPRNNLKKKTRKIFESAFFSFVMFIAESASVAKTFCWKPFSNIIYYELR